MLTGVFVLRAMLLLPFFLVTLTLCNGFNIDTKTVLFRYGPSGSHFGFAVAPHFQNDTSVILVGAPHGESGQPGTKQTGSVYKCGIFNTPHTNCDPIQVEYRNDNDFQRPPDRIGSRDLHYLGKNKQLLGFTVQSTGLRQGGALVCAPLIQYGNESAYPEGVCYWLDNDLKNVDLINTCHTLSKQDRHNAYAVCEQGFSAFMDKNVMLTGTPGARKWTGGVHARYYKTTQDNGNPNLIDDSYDRWTMSHEGIKERGIIRSFTSHDYLGYSVRYGKFGFLNETEDDMVFTVVSGAPRANQIGAVTFFPFTASDNFESKVLGMYDNRFRLNGSQVGSAYGFALEVLDLNNDGFDDLLVSAPYEFHTDREIEQSGAVYVYFSKGLKQTSFADDVFEKPIVLLGQGPHSQFGAAITKLGSINLDKFEDFAIGAPYANNGQGVVYIYHGAQYEDFSRTPSQIIEVPDLKLYSGRSPFQTFGSSLAGSVDLDNNGYKDLVVGAYGSDTVAILRTRPIIDVELGYSMDEKYIKINNQCKKKAKACFTVKTSLKLLDTKYLSRGVTFQCKLIVVPFAPGVATRAVFEQHMQNEMTFNCGRAVSETRDLALIVPSNNEDWIHPLRLNLSIAVQDTEKTNQLLPIINLKNSRTSFVIDFDKECGVDNKCKTDLEMNAVLANISQSDNGSYVIKANQQDLITVKFTVENKAEKAYASTFYVFYDHNELDEPVLKSGQLVLDKHKINDGILSIKLGNPLKDKEKLSFDLSFALVRSENERVSASLNFTALVNSTSVDTNLTNNRWEADVRLIKEADLQVEGDSNPYSVHFSKGNDYPEDEEDIGPNVIHRYTVTNMGPFYAKKVSVFIDWPLKLNYSLSKYVLYLLEPPVVRQKGEVKPCKMQEDLSAVINPEGILIEEVNRLVYNGSIRSKREALPLSIETQNAQFSLGKKHAHNLKKKTIKVMGENTDIFDVNCKDGTGDCLNLVCLIDHIEANEAVQIEIRGRLWNSTFDGDYTGIEFIAISSSVHVQVDPKQGIIETETNNFAEVTTYAYPDRPSQDQKLTLKLILLAILIALALLALFVYLCAKCGFFKRKRPSELHTAHYKNEMEPLSEF